MQQSYVPEETGQVIEVKVEWQLVHTVAFCACNGQNINTLSEIDVNNGGLKIVASGSANLSLCQTARS